MGSEVGKTDFHDSQETRKKEQQIDQGQLPRPSMSCSPNPDTGQSENYNIEDDVEQVCVPDPSNIHCVWAESPIVVDVQSVLEHSQKGLSAVN